MSYMIFALFLLEAFFIACISPDLEHLYSEACSLLGIIKWQWWWEQSKFYVFQNQHSKVRIACCIAFIQSLPGILRSSLKTNNKYQLQCSQHQVLKKIYTRYPKDKNNFPLFSWLFTILNIATLEPQLKFHQAKYHKKDGAISTSWL